VFITTSEDALNVTVGAVTLMLVGAVMLIVPCDVIEIVVPFWR
jgi:hypothetical protein